MKTTSRTKQPKTGSQYQITELGKIFGHVVDILYLVCRKLFLKRT